MTRPHPPKIDVGFMIAQATLAPDPQKWLTVRASPGHDRREQSAFGWVRRISNRRWLALVPRGVRAGVVVVVINDDPGGATVERRLTQAGTGNDAVFARFEDAAEVEDFITACALPSRWAWDPVLPDEEALTGWIFMPRGDRRRWVTLLYGYYSATVTEIPGGYVALVHDPARRTINPIGDPPARFSTPQAAAQAAIEHAGFLRDIDSGCPSDAPMLPDLRDAEVQRTVRALVGAA